MLDVLGEVGGEHVAHQTRVDHGNAHHRAAEAAGALFIVGATDPQHVDQRFVGGRDGRQHRMDGVIATNTTLSRAEVEGLPNANEAGGLSGAPVFERSTAVLKKLAGHLKGEVPIIGVGGIMQGADAVAKLDAGASLVQLYSGFIYRGPDLVGEVAKAIAERKH